MRDFALRGPPIVDDIRSILSDYPSSLATILLEALQNAGDAGATRFWVSLHSSGGAPYLVFGNNAPFTDSDLESWQTLRKSGKRGRPACLGNKGCGAKGFFHAADVVLVAFQRKRLFLNDPLGRLHQHGGCLCDDAAADREWRAIARGAPGLVDLCDALEVGARADDDTVFVLPLRAAPSELWDDVFDAADVEAALQAFAGASASSILHLPLRLESIEVGVAGSWTQRQEVSVTGADGGVAEGYPALLEPLQRFRSFEELYEVASPEWVRDTMGAATRRFRMDLGLQEERSGARRPVGSAAFHVFAAFSTDPELRALGPMAEQVPIAGVAFPMESAAGGDAARPQFASVCNFLPVPGEEAGLPVSLNASLRVTENRQQLFLGSESLVGLQRARRDWNRRMLLHVLPVLYSDGLEALAAEARADASAAFYRWFPDPQRLRAGIWGEVAGRIAELLSGRRVLLTAAQAAPVAVGEVRILDRGQFGKEHFARAEAFVEAFCSGRGSGQSVVCVPLHVEQFLSGWRHVGMKDFAENLFLGAYEEHVSGHHGRDRMSEVDMDALFDFLLAQKAHFGIVFPNNMALRSRSEGTSRPAEEFLDPSPELLAVMESRPDLFPRCPSGLEDVLRSAFAFRAILSRGELEESIRMQLAAPASNQHSLMELVKTLFAQCFPRGSPVRVFELAGIWTSEAVVRLPFAAKSSLFTAMLAHAGFVDHEEESPLREVACVPVASLRDGEVDRLATPSECCLSAKDFTPLLYRVPGSFRHADRFIERILGVRRGLLARDVEQLVAAVESQARGTPLQTELAAGVCEALRAWCERQLGEGAPPFVLCEDGVLREPRSAFFHDGSDSTLLQSGDVFALHAFFTIREAQRMGVRALSERLDGGVGLRFEHGVNPVTMLRKTMEDYQQPGSLGVLTVVRESCQNMDDNRAREVFVVLDERYHGDGARLEAGASACGEGSVRSFGGPALIIAGDSVTSDAQFEAAQRYGESAKKERYDSDGRFGVGMAVNYWLADVVEWFSSEQLCVFDPCRLGPAASRQSAGVRLREGDLRTHWKGQLRPLDRLWQALPDCPRGTVFRLPLRRQPSPLKAAPVNMALLLAELRGVGACPQAFLFDRYLERLKVVRIDEDGRLEVMWDWRKSFEQFGLPLPEPKALGAPAEFREYHEARQFASPRDFYSSLPGTDEDLERLVDSGDGKPRLCCVTARLEDRGPGLGGGAIAEAKDRLKMRLWSLEFIQVLHFAGARSDLQRALDHRRQTDYALLPLGGVAIPIAVTLRKTRTEVGGTFWMGDPEFAKVTNMFDVRFFCFRELHLDGHADRCSEVFVNAHWHLKSSRTQFCYDDPTQWNAALIETVVAPAWAAAFLEALRRFQALQDVELRAYHAQAESPDEVAEVMPPSARCMVALPSLIPKVYGKHGPRFWASFSDASKRLLMERRLPCVPVSSGSPGEAEDASPFDQKRALGQLRQELTCPITLEVPARAACFDGDLDFVFDRAAIERHLQTSRVHPMTRKPVERITNQPVVSTIGQEFGRKTEPMPLEDRERLWAAILKSLAGSTSDHARVLRAKDILERVEKSTRGMLERITIVNASHELAQHTRVEWVPIDTALFDVDVAGSYHTNKQVASYYGVFRPLLRRLMPVCLAPASVQHAFLPLGGAKLSAQVLVDCVAEHTRPLAKLIEQRGGTPLPLADVPRDVAFKSAEACVGILDFLCSMPWEDKALMKECLVGVPVLMYGDASLVLASGDSRLFEGRCAPLLPRRPDLCVSLRIKSAVSKGVPGVAHLALEDLTLDRIAAGDTLLALQTSGQAAWTEELKAWVKLAREFVEQSSVDNPHERCGHLPLLSAEPGVVVLYSFAGRMAALPEKKEHIRGVLQKLLGGTSFYLAEDSVEWLWQPFEVKSIACSAKDICDNILVTPAVKSRIETALSADERRMLLRLFEHEEPGRHVRSLPCFEFLDGRIGPLMSRTRFVELLTVEEGTLLAMKPAMFSRVDVVRYRPEMGFLNPRLIGLLSDGDLQRALLGNMGLPSLDFDSRRRWARYLCKVVNNYPELELLDFLKGFGEGVFFLEEGRGVPDFLDPEQKGFRVVIESPSAFPPPNFSTGQWLPLLRRLGLKQTLDPESILREARAIASSGASASVSKSKALLEYVVEQLMVTPVEKSFQKLRFLEELAKTPFLPARSRSLGAGEQCIGLRCPKEMLWDKGEWDTVFTEINCLAFDPPSRFAKQALRDVFSGRLGFLEAGLGDRARHLHTIVNFLAQQAAAAPSPDRSLMDVLQAMNSDLGEAGKDAAADFVEKELGFLSDSELAWVPSVALDGTPTLSRLGVSFKRPRSILGPSTPPLLERKVCEVHAEVGTLEPLCRLLGLRDMQRQDILRLVPTLFGATSGRSLSPNELEAYSFLMLRFVQSAENDFAGGGLEEAVRSMLAEVECGVLLLTSEGTLVTTGVLSSIGVSDFDPPVQDAVHGSGAPLLDPGFEWKVLARSEFYALWLTLFDVVDPRVRFREHIEKKDQADGTPGATANDIAAFLHDERFVVSMARYRSLFSRNSVLEERREKLRAAMSALRVCFCTEIRKVCVDTDREMEPLLVRPVACAVEEGVLYLSSEFSTEDAEHISDLVSALLQHLGDNVSGMLASMEEAHDLMQHVLEHRGSDLVGDRRPSNKPSCDVSIGMPVHAGDVLLESPSAPFHVGDYVACYSEEEDAYQLCKVLEVEDEVDTMAKAKVLRMRYLVSTRACPAGVHLAHVDLFAIRESSGAHVGSRGSREVVLVPPSVSTASAEQPIDADAAQYLDALRRRLGSNSDLQDREYRLHVRRLLLEHHPDKRGFREDICHACTQFLLAQYARLEQDHAFRYVYEPSAPSTFGALDIASPRWKRAAKMHRKPKRRAGGWAFRPPPRAPGDSIAAAEGGGGGERQEADEDSSESDSEADAQAVGEAMLCLDVAAEKSLRMREDIAAGRFADACFFASEAVHKVLVSAAVGCGHRSHPEARACTGKLQKLYRDVVQRRRELSSADVEAHVTQVEREFVEARCWRQREEYTKERADDVSRHCAAIFEHFGVERPEEAAAAADVRDSSDSTGDVVSFLAEVGGEQGSPAESAESGGGPASQPGNAAAGESSDGSTDGRPPSARAARQGDSEESGRVSTARV